MIGVNHHDSAGGLDYADQLGTHGTDVVVTDLAELLDRPEAPRAAGGKESTLARPGGGGRNGEMEYTARGASSVTFVAELDR